MMASTVDDPRDSDPQTRQISKKFPSVPLLKFINKCLP